MIMKMKTLIAVLILIPSLVFAQSGPKLYSPDGTYLGRMNNNRYDPESISNPIGIYGSRISPRSINNPIGTYGSRLSPQSPYYGKLPPSTPLTPITPLPTLKPLGSGF